MVRVAVEQLMQRHSVTVRSFDFRHDVPASPFHLEPVLRGVMQAVIAGPANREFAGRRLRAARWARRI